MRPIKSITPSIQQISLIPKDARLSCLSAWWWPSSSYSLSRRQEASWPASWLHSPKGDAPGAVQLTVGALHMCTECLMGWLQKMSICVEQPNPSARSGTFICVTLEQVRPLDDGSIIFIMTWARLMIKKADPSARSLSSVCPWCCFWLIKLPPLTPLSTRLAPTQLRPCCPSHSAGLLCP